MRLPDWTGWPPDDAAGLDAVDAFDVGAMPGRVPVGPTDVDADGDGTPDTVVVGSGEALALFTDLDGDGLADQELRLGATEDPIPDEVPWWDALGDLVDAALGR
ncbi:MAG: hypothetical protein L0I76_12435 [Pseudonocardia sp.]|nr:hypothetical protein [Pseudonocardia sp.]